MLLCEETCHYMMVKFQRWWRVSIAYKVLKLPMKHSVYLQFWRLWFLSISSIKLVSLHSVAVLWLGTQWNSWLVFTHHTTPHHTTYHTWPHTILHHTAPNQSIFISRILLNVTKCSYMERTVGPVGRRNRDSHPYLMIPQGHVLLERNAACSGLASENPSSLCLW